MLENFLTHKKTCRDGDVVLSKNNKNTIDTTYKHQRSFKDDGNEKGNFNYNQKSTVYNYGIL